MVYNEPYLFTFEIFQIRRFTELAEEFRMICLFIIYLQTRFITFSLNEQIW